MQASSYFLSKVKQSQKYKREHEDFDLEQSIADYFVKIIGLPEAMGREIYDNHADSLDRLAYMIDFFHNSLDKTYAKEFSDDHWQEVIELIDRYAKKDEIDYLQEMMQYLLDIGQL
ncbi:hypothetical protein PVA44_03190 [Entomospira nematocerorum]|uniref:Uncharacterized protein n=1 Tax=Entomospira nematocerorum TaxID=2719987 RepID=A0A968GFR6_9SPIO|nr:hypothetical protein [Entomospira nematocera]NIZ46961.1 hypothetical protein [Entomospira nematocera]WDI34493.1 hypothetical protein PVA44_03190 [Entomospira nematocera]